MDLMIKKSLSEMSSILRLPGTVVSVHDVQLLGANPSPSTLYRRLNYRVGKGELYQVRRGLYAKDKHYDRLELGSKIFTPAYISFETVLAAAGLIQQYYASVSVASYKNKRLICDDTEFHFRRLKPAILLNVNGLERRAAYFIATPERAYLDILYLKKDYDFTNLATLDWKKVAELLPLYDNKRMTRVVEKHLKALQKA